MDHSYPKYSEAYVINILYSFSESKSRRCMCFRSDKGKDLDKSQSTTHEQEEAVNFNCHVALVMLFSGFYRPLRSFTRHYLRQLRRQCYLWR